MDDQAKRIVLFLVGCMGARIALVWLAYAFPAYLPVMGALALIPAAGFLVIWTKGWRKTGAEVFGDRIWWNDLRPVHGMLYAVFAVLALQRYRPAWIVLLIDVIIGFMAFIWHHASPVW